MEKQQVNLKLVRRLRLIDIAWLRGPDAAIGMLAVQCLGLMHDYQLYGRLLERSNLNSTSASYVASERN